MNRNLYLKFLGGALAVASTGTVGVIAQNQARESSAPVQAERQASAPNDKDEQTCPMMGKGGGTQMNMPTMDCCKKMGMSMKRPTTGSNDSSERIPSSNQ
jgi:hypothetical protein